jgi:hypothetical protein
MIAFSKPGGVNSFPRPGGATAQEASLPNLHTIDLVQFILRLLNLEPSRGTLPTAELENAFIESRRTVAIEHWRETRAINLGVARGAC